MTKEKNEILTAKDIYAEIGINYRYFLNWRHALFAGYLLILYALANSYFSLLEKNRPDLFWVVFLGGFLVSLCCWGLEYRIRDLYQACTNAGCELEKAFQQTGIYLKLDDDKLRNKTITHSRVLNFFFGIISLSMLIMLLLSAYKMIK